MPLVTENYKPKDLARLIKIRHFPRIEIIHGAKDACECTNVPHQFHYSGGTEVRWEKLRIKFGRAWSCRKECRTFVLLNKLLPAVACTISKFTLLVEQNHNGFLENVPQTLTFPNLQSLKFQDVCVYTTSEEYTNFVKELVSRAPNLETLYTRGRLDLSANLLGRSQAVHVTDYPYSPSLGEIPEDAAGSFQMTRMTLIHIYIPKDFCVERFNRILSSVLKASRSTLNWMEIDLTFLLPLMDCETILTNMTTLKITLDTDWFDETLNYDAYDVIKSFDFNRIFPELNTVEIEADWESHVRQKSVLKAFMPVVERIDGNAAPNRAVSVRNLSVKWNARIERRSLRALAQMFPNIENLSIQAVWIIPFEFLWSSWRNLEELDITLIGAERDPSLNLDSIFCGISPEKVAELKQRDDEYLRAVDIVRRMSNITDFRRLRTLTLNLDAMFHSDPFQAGRPDFLFSKVTPLLAFRGLRACLVTDHEDIKTALSHLNPYVPVILRSRD